MNISKWSGAVRGLAFVAAAACVAPSAMASDRLDGLFSRIDPSLRDRMFWNLQVVSTKTKTKSEQPKDQFEGGVVSITDLVAMRNALEAELSNPDLDPQRRALIESKVANQFDLNVYSYGNGASAVSALNLLEAGLVSDYGFDPRSGNTPGNAFIGTPQGIRAKSKDPSDTVALSVGYFLDDGYHWAVEALLLGAPLKAKVVGAGTNDRGEPNQLVGREIINTKLLPPLVKLGYYFGRREALVRPYVGVGAMYAIFFDSKTTAFFDEYQGGKTSVSIKNDLGIGPFIGLDSRLGDSGWRVGLSLGRIKLTADTTLVTRNTMFTSASPVLRDLGTNTRSAITVGDSNLAPVANQFAPPGVVPFPNNELTTQLMKDLAEYRQLYRGGDGSLGTFVRTQRNELTNTIFILNVGKSF